MPIFEERGEAVDLVALAGQGRRQVEAEPVDVHLGHPVAQRVHDQLQRVGVSHVEAVRSAEHTSELQSLMRISYAVFCLKNKIHTLSVEQPTTPNNSQRNSS